jgi:hypothetical protein
LSIELLVCSEFGVPGFKFRSTGLIFILRQKIKFFGVATLAKTLEILFRELVIRKLTKKTSKAKCFMGSGFLFYG